MATTKALCVTCGSALFSQNRHDPELTLIRMGAFDGDAGVRASLRAHVASAAVWEPIPDTRDPVCRSSRTVIRLRPAPGRIAGRAAQRQHRTVTAA